MVLGTAGVTAGILLCPDENSFREYLRITHGGAARTYLEDAAKWLGMKGASVTVTSYGVLAMGRRGARTFLGALGTWIELPTKHTFSLSASRPGGANPLDLEVIVGVNVLVMLTWHVVSERHMRRHFTCNSVNAAERPHTILTSAFSHISPLHLINNMHTLMTVGPLLQGVLGSGHVRILYMGGALASSLVSVLYHAALGHRDVGSLGASGAVMALLACNACRLPQQEYHYLGGAPLSAQQLLYTRLILDCISASMGMERFVDVWGHLGGALFGTMYYMHALGGNRNNVFAMLNAQKVGRTLFTPY